MPVVGGGPSFGERLRGQLRNLATLVTLVALVALFSLLSPSFATWGNLANVLQQVSITAISARPTATPEPLSVCTWRTARSFVR